MNLTTLFQIIGISLVPCVAFSQDTVSSDPDKGQTSLFDLGLTELLNVRVVTAAAGFEQNVEEAPATVTVIDAEEWQAMGATDLFEALLHVPGLHITKAQTAVSNNRPVVRGLSGTFGQQILVLIDGIRFRAIRDGGSFWGQRIPLNSFKRIEIIRSPGSAIYGADAVGGIINLVSYDAGEVPRRMTVRAGNFDTQQFELSQQLNFGESLFQFALGAQTSDGDTNRIVGADLQTQLDEQFDTSASRAPGPMNEDHEIYSARAHWQYRNLNVQYYNWLNRENGNGAGAAQALDPDGSFRQQSQTLEATYDLSSLVRGSMKLTANWRRVYGRLISNIFPAGARLPLDDDGNLDFVNATRLVDFPYGMIGIAGYDDQATTLWLNHIFDLAENHRVRWAVGYEFVDTDVFEQKNFGTGVLGSGETVAPGELTDVTDTPFVYIPNKTRETYFVALQDQWAISETLQSTLGVRYDYYTDFGSTVNPRLGITWQTTPRLTAKLFLGTAFRTPSFVDLYSQNNPAGLGNPDLQPEKIKTLDGGFALNYLFNDALYMEINLFRYEADNIIAFQPSAGGQVAQNSGELHMNGLEYQVNWRPSRQITLEFNYSLLHEQTQRDVDISAVPKQMANLSLNWRLDGWNLYLGAKWVGDRDRTENDTRPKIDDYVWVNSRLQKRWRAFEFGLSVKNLFDEDAREPSNGFIVDDYPLAGRHWLFDVTYAFDERR